MQVTFTSRATESSQLRDPVVQRVRFVMRRMTWLVPRGGVDTRCQVQFATDRTGTIVVTSVARDWRTALHTASTRTVRVPMRAWQRARDPRTSGQHANSYDR